MFRLIAILFIILIGVSAGICNNRHIHASDEYLRNRIVKLINASGSSCTGVEVRTPKKAVYTLTAGHCRVLLDGNKQMLAIDEQGHKTIVSFVAEDTKSDLLLLTAIGTKFVTIGDSVSAHEQVKAITHGHGLAAFRSDGEMIQPEVVTFEEEDIATDADLKDCMDRAPKTIVYQDVNFFTGVNHDICLIQTTEMIATTLILPGSSGGPLFNMKGEVVGIASAGTPEDPFGRFVQLHDIKEFLKAL